MNSGPIFLGGLDRSGKTLLRLSLSSHPNIALTRRTYMWPRFYNRYGDLGQRDNFERCLAAMLAHRPMQVLQPDPERIRREFWQGEPSYARLFALFHQHYAERQGKPRWGDQTGLIERYADQIFAAYPDARMIHMVRDPRDRYGASLAPAARRSGKAGEAIARWLYSVDLAKRNQQRFPANYKVVRYEALMTDREAVLHEICAFLGEEYTPEMLTLETAIRFGDKDEEVDNPETNDNLVVRERGEPYVAPQDIAFMQSWARSEMASYGYECKMLQLSLRERLVFSLVDWPASFARMIAWRASGSTSVS